MKNTLMYRIIGIGFLVLFTGLFSCQTPDEISHQNVPIPDGQGRAVMELPVKVSPRTVMPDSITIRKYRVILTPPPDASWRPVDKVYNSGETVSVFIGPGKWNGGVYAYGKDSENPIARAEVDFEISAGQTIHIPVDLQWNLPEKLTGNGALKINLAFPGDLKMSDVEAALTVTKLDDSPVMNNAKLDEGDNPFTLMSGVFIAKVIIKDRWDRTGYFTEVIHVIPGETSVWLINVTDQMQEGEYGNAILIISVDPIKSPTLLAPVFEVERGMPVLYSLAGSAGQYKTIRWYIDGILQASANDSMTLLLQTQERTTGMNEVLVVVTDVNGLVTSSSTRLNILSGTNNAGIRVRNAAELATALETIGTSTKAETTIYIIDSFTTQPVTLGRQFSGKKIILAAENGNRRTIGLASQGSMFTITENVSLLVDKCVTLEGIAEDGNNSPLVSVHTAEFILRGELRNNSCFLIKDRDYPLAVGGIYAENSQVTLDGGMIEGMAAKHSYPYETYLYANLTSVGTIYAKNSVIKLENDAVVQNAKAYIEDSPSVGAGGIFLDSGSTGIIINSAIQGCLAESYNFDSQSAGAVFVSENSRLILQTGAKITGNLTCIGDLNNIAAGTVLVRGRLDMGGGVIESNTLRYYHRYDFSCTYGSAGIYIGSQAEFTKTEGLVCGADSPVGNQLDAFEDTQTRGTSRVAAAAYYADQDRIEDYSF